MSDHMKTAPLYVRPVHPTGAAMEQGDTPRTDAAAYTATDYDDVVSVDFARDLERELAAATRERDEALDVLRRNGFVLCDIAACNCGSWHARYGIPERMAEIKDALTEAGHPMTNENGHLPIKALAELVKERDEARARVLADVVEMLSTQHTWLTRVAAINLVAGLYGQADFVFALAATESKS